jgi:hypothetical protein
MKKLSFKEIFISILISYLGVAYINNELNPINLPSEVKVIQLFILAFSFFVQLEIKKKK